MTIICPSYNDWTKEEDTEKYIVYNVSILDAGSMRAAWKLGLIVLWSWIDLERATVVSCIPVARTQLNLEPVLVTDDCKERLGRLQRWGWTGPLLSVVLCTDDLLGLAPVCGVSV